MKTIEEFLKSREGIIRVGKRIVGRGYRVSDNEVTKNVSETKKEVNTLFDAILTFLGQQREYHRCLGALYENPHKHRKEC